MSKEFGPIAMNSSAPTSVAERGGISTAGGRESRINNSAGYKPMFSISKEGNISPTGGNSMRKNTATNRFSELTPFKGEASYFSLDKVAPIESLKSGTILYQRPSAENEQHPRTERNQTVMPELKHRITISDRDGKASLNDTEILSKKAEAAPHEGARTPHTPLTEPQAKKSAWVDSQSHLIEQREIRHDIKSQKAEIKSRDEKINPFSTKLNQRVKAVQAMQSQQNAVNPSRIQDLEDKVTREVQNQPKNGALDNKELTTQIEKKASEKMGLVITTQAESKIKASSLSKEQAHVEIATKLQDGAVAARRLTQILESQGVEPQIARQTAVERVTQTLVKTIKDKGLDQSLDLDTAPHSQPKVEVKEYIDSEGHQIREKITKDEFDVITIEKEEIVAERDVIADANRIELATHIGSALLDKAQNGGGSSIHTREVAELMPEEPGEALASFIRTQLNLLLDSEEQYDFFKQTLGAGGHVSNKFQVAQAAKYATDIAPAVRLSRKLTTEKVLPVDEDRAIRRGLNYSMK